MKSGRNLRTIYFFRSAIEVRDYAVNLQVYEDDSFSYMMVHYIAVTKKEM